MVNYLKDIQKLFIGRCDVYVTKNTIDSETKVTKTKRILKYKDIPCRVSVKKLAPAKGEVVNVASKEIKLFLSNEYDIPESSEISVNQNGVEIKYKNSSTAWRYEYHQELILIGREWC